MNLSRQFNRREKILLIVFALLILVALYFYLVQYPASQAAQQSRSETGSIESEMTVLNAKKAKMDKMSKELDELLADPETVAIPEYDNLQQLISFLNTVLSNTEDFSLSFPSISIPEEGSSEHIVRRYLNMNFVSGSYNAARSLIDLLQASPYRCQMDGVSIVPVNELGRQDKSELSLLGSKVEVSLSMVFFENTK